MSCRHFVNRQNVRESLHLAGCNFPKKDSKKRTDQLMRLIKSNDTNFDDTRGIMKGPVFKKEKL